MPQYANQAAMTSDRWRLVQADPVAGYIAETVVDPGRGEKVTRQYGTTLAQLLGATGHYDDLTRARGHNSGRR